ncbi:acyl-CoA-like ligand-binding transcription factor [Actinoallomurus acaciae]|uniref:TetR family transcriptional regulator n=1 Tax=Actinoallomurus acaciae TaxID=502577 RepID=A0ABV5Y881_9ACTN
MRAGANADGSGLRERKKARTRAAIQSNALRLFREQGYDATTIDQIIEAAEVSESTFFRYFPAKEDLVLQDDYPAIVEMYREQPADMPPVQAMRAGFATLFGGMTAEQRAEQQDRVALCIGVPALRAAMLDQFSQTLQLFANAIAARAGRSSDDFKVRTIAGAVLGIMMAVLAEMAENPEADLAALIDRGFVNLESGLEL